jgi:hypothetical protein
MYVNIYCLECKPMLMLHRVLKQILHSKDAWFITIDLYNIHNPKEGYNSADYLRF